MGKVLLLGSATSPLALEWRRILAEEAGACLLATLHPAPLDADDAPHVVSLLGHRGPVRLRVLAAVRRLRELVEGERFEVALAYYLTSYGLLAALALPRRYVAVGAGSDLFPASLRPPRLAAAVLAVRRSAGGVAWAPFMAERMLALGADPSRIIVGPRGIDTGLFRPGTSSERFDGTLRVITTRRLRPVFRHDRLLHAVAMLRQRNRPVRLEIVGEGSEKPRLEAEAARLGLQDHVRFLGSLPRAAVAERLRSSDVFVTLSIKDGLSTSLAEAFACGVFPIASDIPANRELISDRRHGILVGGDDPGEVADALERVANEPALVQAVRDHNLTLTRDRLDIRRNSRRILERAETWLRSGPG